MLAKRKLSGIPLYAFVLGVLLLGMVVWLAVTLALEDRQQRSMDAEIDRASSDLKSAGAQIASIKDVDLQSMNDYISAYAQIEPLQKEYDRKLQNMVELYRTAEERDRKKVLSSGGFTASITPKPGSRCRKSSLLCNRSTESSSGKSPLSTLWRHFPKPNGRGSGMSSSCP